MEIKVIVYFIGRFFSALISLAIIPLFIAWFGQEKYGEYIIIYTTILIFVSGSIGWINQSVIKFHGDYESSDRKVFYSKVHNLTYQISIIALVPLVIFLYFTVNNVSVLLLVVIALTFVFACMYTSKLIENQAELKSMKFSISEILRLSVFLLMVYLIKLFFNGLEIIFLAMLFSYFIGFMFLNKGIVWRDLKVNLRIDKKLVKPFIAFGLPLSIWMMFSPGTNGIDRYIINYSLGAIVLAQYTAVYDVVFKIFTQLANPINSVYQPLLMKIHSSGDIDYFNKTLKKALFYLVIISLPVFIIACVFQDYILIDYLGFKNIEVISTLKKIMAPLMISSFVWQAAIIVQKRLEAKGKTLIMTIILFAVIVLFGVITLFLIPYYGIEIIAYIAVISSISYLTLIILFINYDNKKKPFNR